jgi:putative protease
MGAAALRIEAQDYSPEIVAQVIKIYRAAIDGKNFDADFDALKKITPRKFGSGVYRFKESKNSI